MPVQLRLVNGLWETILNGTLQDETYPSSDLSDLVADAMIAGEMFTHPFIRVLCFGQKISANDYWDLLSRIDAATDAGDTDAPCLNPTRPISLSKLRSLW